jgi:mRNA interferase RelE/StbE
MFKLVYAKSVRKDLKKITPRNLPKIKEAIKELEKFPNVHQISHLTDHPIADYRLRVGNYRVLFDIYTSSVFSRLLITHQGAMDVS